MRFLSRYKLSRILNRVMASILLLVLVLAVSGCSQQDAQTAAVLDTQPDTQSNSVDYIYGIPMDENAGVIVTSTADLYVSPDVKSSRITQAIFNQPISIISDENGWAKVKTVDGNWLDEVEEFRQGCFQYLWGNV